MKKKKRRGISFGTFFMLGLSLVIILGVASIFSKIGGDPTQAVPTQELVSALSSVIDLPKLTLSDIPINNTLAPQATPVPAPEPNQGAGQSTAGQGQEQNAAGQGGNIVVPPVTPVPAATAQPTPVPPPKTAVLTLGGTAAFTKNIRQSGYNDESKTYDFRHLLTHVQQEFVGDLSIATLENTIVPSKDLNHVNTVADVLTSLKNGGINVLAIGNEHVLDYGIQGLQATEGEVRKAGFLLAGGAETSRSQQGLLLDAGALRIGILEYVDNLSSAGAKQLKKEEAQGSVALYDGAVVAGQVAQLRQSGADVVLVMLHWGKDNQKKVTKAQQEIAQQVADAGADILLGSHTERVFPITYTTGTGLDGVTRQMLTIYSLGALVTQERADANCGGVLLNVHLSYDQALGRAAISQVTYAPTYMWRYKEEGKFVYRLVASDQPAPEGMDEGQTKVKEKILGVVQKALGESPITLRQP